MGLGAVNLRTLLTCLWPGLAPLWWRGSWQGLVEATVFAAGLNLLLTATFVWPQWVEAPWPMVGWVALSGYWLVATWRSCQALPRLIDGKPDGISEGLFRQAQAEYLKGNWYDAEKLIGQLLQRRPRDVEGLLLLATLYRHTGRPTEGLATLDRLERLDGAGRWILEITTERRRLMQLAEEGRGSSGAASNITAAAEDLSVGASQAA